jgi:hypothetical protein
MLKAREKEDSLEKTQIYCSLYARMEKLRLLSVQEWYKTDILVINSLKINLRVNSLKIYPLILNYFTSVMFKW